jgi:predicted TIM-barrel fold metal-dependent hydrolase
VNEAAINPVIDTNVYLSRWPTRRLPLEETPRLVEKLKACGTVRAWAGSFDALLHKDIGGVNARLATECQMHGAGLLVPFGTVNPTLPDWPEDLRRCHEVHQMPGIRLHPNYHGYKLDEPVAAKLLAAAAERSLLVQIALRMEDPRTQHRLLSVPDVDPAPLLELLAGLPKLRVQLLNALNNVRPDVLDKLIAAGNVSVEIAMLEGIGGITQILKHVPAERVLHGSYAPFFAIESALGKLHESALAQPQFQAIANGNAEQLVSLDR